LFRPHGRAAVIAARTSDLNWSVALAVTTPVGSPAVGSDEAVSQLMASEDVPGGVKLAIQLGTYQVFANDGCNEVGLEHDSCYDPDS
jgi:hypothetical protein